MNLLFCINQKFQPLLLQCLRSIARKGGEPEYDAYILHSDLGETDRAAIQAQAPGCFRIHFVAVDPKEFDGFPESKRYPRQIYYRLAAPLLLPETLDRILYLDVDTIVINPLREFYDTDFEGSGYIACTHIREALTKFNDHRLKVPENSPYVNTGVMLLNLPKLRGCLTMEAIKETALKKVDSFLLPDQDLLTVLHGDLIKLADTQRYNLSDRILNLYNMAPNRPKHDEAWVRQNAVILHFCGKNRPWLPHYVGTLGVFYRELVEGQ